MAPWELGSSAGGPSPRAFPARPVLTSPGLPWPRAPAVSCVLLSSPFSLHSPAQNVSPIYWFPQKSMHIEVWEFLKILVDYQGEGLAPCPLHLSLSALLLL